MIFFNLWDKTSHSKISLSFNRSKFVALNNRMMNILQFYFLFWYFTVYKKCIHNDSFPIKSAFLPPFRLNRRSCLLSESENPTYRSYVLTTWISNWLIWKQKVCKTFLSSSRNISIIIVTQNNLKRVSWPIFWTKSVTL